MISLIQTAEGALNETHSILQRMRELSVQSSNDTNTDADRAELQKEVDQLSEELTRIADNTEFNTKNLLDGSFTGKFHIGANSDQNLELSINKMDATALGVKGGDAGVATGEITVTGTALAASGTTAVGTTAVEYSVEQLDGSLTVLTADMEASTSDVTANYALKDSSGNYSAISSDGTNWYFAESAQSNLGDLEFADTDADGALTNAKVTLSNATLTSGTVSVVENASTQIEMTTNDSVYNFNSASEGLASGDYTISTTYTMKPAGATSVLLNSKNEVVASSVDQTNFTDLDGNTLFAANTAYSDGDSITITGSNGIDISSQSAADNAITSINNAIESVSAERSKLGAYQNRLEHTINNLGTSSENLTAAESRIRDVDYALAA
nr:flagellin [Bacillus marinisedimentorum]